MPKPSIDQFVKDVQRVADIYSSYVAGQSRDESVYRDSADGMEDAQIRASCLHMSLATILNFPMYTRMAEQSGDEDTQSNHLAEVVADAQASAESSGVGFNPDQFVASILASMPQGVKVVYRGREVSGQSPSEEVTSTFRNRIKDREHLLNSRHASPKLLDAVFTDLVAESIADAMAAVSELDSTSRDQRVFDTLIVAIAIAGHSELLSASHPDSCSMFSRFVFGMSTGTQVIFNCQRLCMVANKLSRQLHERGIASCSKKRKDELIKRALGKIEKYVNMSAMSATIVEHS
jgi:hypothetical protein